MSQPPTNKRGRPIGSLSLVLLLAIGSGVVWAFVIGWCGGLLNQIASRKAVYQSVFFLNDGAPGIQSTGGGVAEGELFHTIEGERIANDSYVLDRRIYTVSLGGVKTPGGGGELVPWRADLRFDRWAPPAECVVLHSRWPAERRRSTWRDMTATPSGASATSDGKGIARIRLRSKTNSRWTASVCRAAIISHRD